MHNACLHRAYLAAPRAHSVRRAFGVDVVRFVVELSQAEPDALSQAEPDARNSNQPVSQDLKLKHLRKQLVAPDALCGGRGVDA